MSPEQVIRLLRNKESFSLFAWAPTLYNPKLRQRLHRISVPTLCLWGEADRVASPDFGRLFAGEIRGAEFQIVNDAGHYVHVDQGLELAHRIASFANRPPDHFKPETPASAGKQKVRS